MMRYSNVNNGLAVLLILSIVWSCSENDFAITRLNYGTSFNMCIGYCKNEITMESGLVKFTKSGWQDTVKSVTCCSDLDKETWQFFRSDLNVSAFLELPETIGCPDCADGGADWIEAELVSGEVHKVTFENGNPPEVLKAYVDSLREQMQLASHCSD